MTKVGRLWAFAASLQSLQSVSTFNVLIYRRLGLTGYKLPLQLRQTSPTSAVACKPDRKYIGECSLKYRLVPQAPTYPLPRAEIATSHRRNPPPPPPLQLNSTSHRDFIK